jgi:hypothetical protein
VREIAIADAESAASLSEELGYPVSLSDMENRIRKLPGLTDHVVYVASLANSVVAWIDVGVYSSSSV